MRPQAQLRFFWLFPIDILFKEENPWEEVQRLKREYLQLDIVIREPIKATQEEGFDYDPKYPGTVVDVTSSVDVRLKIFGSKRRFSTSVLDTIKQFSARVQETKVAAVTASSDVKDYLERSEEASNLKDVRNKQQRKTADLIFRCCKH